VLQREYPSNVGANCVRPHFEDVAKKEIDMACIINYYNEYDEENRTASRSGQVEFLTTMNYIEKYLFPGAKILEIGAATGKYSHTLARQGYAVDAVELVPHNIEIFESKITDDENISVVQGDARDLSAFENDIYDITLVLGPLYHLHEKEDKKKVISEALRVTKPGGVVFAAYIISDGVILDDGIIRNKFDIREKIALGKLDAETFRTKLEPPDDIFEFVRKEDIDDLMQDFSATRLHYLATDLITRLVSEKINEMSDEQFDFYFKCHLAICERPDVVGMTVHSLDVFRKK